MKVFASSARGKILNIVLFQLGWFACVFGGDYVALGVAVLIFVIHKTLFVANVREWALVSAFTAGGFVIDNALMYFGVFESSLPFAPIWLIVLWSLLGLTLCHSLKWMQEHFFLASIFAAVGAPWSYWAGSQFVDIHINPPMLGLVIVSLIWAVIFPISLWCAKHFVGAGDDKVLVDVKAPLVTLIVLIGAGASVHSILPHSANAQSSFESTSSAPEKHFDVPVRKTSSQGDAYAVGYAFDYSGENLLYRELHTPEKNFKQEVVYIAPDGKLIASKNLDFEKSLTSPSYLLRNFWSKEISRAHWENASLLLVFGQFSDVSSIDSGSNIKDAKKIQEKFISDADVVVDAGFDYYVRDNWTALLAGDKKIFSFAVASRLSTLKMKINKVDCRSKLENIDYGNTVCLSAEPANRLLRLLVPSIELSYDLSTRQLLRFRGLGNIADGEGKLMKVDIRYVYS